MFDENLNLADDSSVAMSHLKTSGMGTRMNGGVQPSPSACTFKLPHIGSEASITTGSGIKLQRKRIIKRQK